MRADDQDKSAPAPPAVRRLLEKQFLGPEALTWIYFSLLEEGLELSLAEAFPKDTSDDEAVVRFQIGKRMALKAVDASGARVSLSGPGLDDSGEVLQAIRRGALVDVLSLDVQVQSRTYSVVMRGEDGALSVKLPDLFSEPEDAQAATVDDPLAPKKPKRRPQLPLEEILALRMQCADEIERVLDALFHKFLVRRLARAWQNDDVQRMRKHIAGGLKQRMVDV
jgi:hypothetical protein